MRIGEKKYACRVWWGNFKWTDLVKDIRVDGNIILELMLNKFEGVDWILGEVSPLCFQ
jgi:hypothetical protein